jgi:hypothetical protein
MVTMGRRAVSNKMLDKSAWIPIACSSLLSRIFVLSEEARRSTSTHSKRVRVVCRSHSARTAASDFKYGSEGDRSVRDTMFLHKMQGRVPLAPLTDHEAFRAASSAMQAWKRARKRSLPIRSPGSRKLCTLPAVVGHIACKRKRSNVDLGPDPRIHTPASSAPLPAGTSGVLQILLNRQAIYRPGWGRGEWEGSGLRARRAAGLREDAGPHV